MNRVLSTFLAYAALALAATVAYFVTVGLMKLRGVL